MGDTPVVEETPLAGVLSIQPRVFEDVRGYFVEVFNEDTFADATGLSVRFVQDNESESALGTLRGIHYQIQPAAQGKLVRVGDGAVFDVVVDLRQSSDTFGEWFGAVLSQENHTQLWIPPGFGHGFLALTDGARVLYKSTDFYSAEHSRSVRWDDSTIGITWPTDHISKVLVSENDAEAPSLGDAEVFE
jgi:dTDP-4-dehydrorhamnose 3,5-epimerase